MRKATKTSATWLSVIPGIAAQIVFAPFAWVAINKPLNWWRKVLPASIRPALAKLWPLTLALGSLSFLIGLFIAITGYIPGQSDPEIIINICWAFIFGGGLGLYLITFAAGFAHDIEQTIAEQGARQHLVNQGERHNEHKR